MKTRRPGVLLVGLLMAGCDLGFSLDLSDITWDTPHGPDELWVRGEVYIGGRPAAPREAIIHIYAPTDTLEPISSWRMCADGYYCLTFGASPDPRACGYLIGVERWDGARSEKQPLFVSPPLPCVPAPSIAVGQRIEFPTYAPLDPPFTLTGVVYVDSARAGAGAATAIVNAEWGSGFDLKTDGTGRYTLTTTDGAERVRLCSSVQVRVTSGVHTDLHSQLGSVPLRTCGPTREMPEVRFGWGTALRGSVHSGGAPVGWRAAHLELLGRYDSTVVGDTAWTRDDGSFQLFLPFGTRLDCESLVRVTHGSQSLTYRMHDVGSGPCGYGLNHVFQLP
jgi:hypothetical protein